MGVALDETIEAWGDLASWWVTAWTGQTNAFLGAPDDTARAAAIQDGIGLAVISAINVADTILESIAYLTMLEDGIPPVIGAYQTPSSAGERTLHLVAIQTAPEVVGLQASPPTNPPSKLVPMARLTVSPAVLHDTERNFTISCNADGLEAGLRQGSVVVRDAGTGTPIETLVVRLVI